MNRRILVVDDEPQVRRLLSAALRRRGFDVIEAANGAQALSAVDDPGVGLLLSDIDMPAMDGYELADLVKRKYPDCRVLLMSGHACNRPEYPYPFLRKPFMPSDLVERVAEVLQRHQPE